MIGMYSCKQVSQIVSESLDKKLSFWTRIQLWMHLGMCGLCKAFRKNMIRVDKEAKHYAEDLELNKTSGMQLSADARKRINRALNPNGQ